MSAAWHLAAALAALSVAVACDGSSPPRADQRRAGDRARGARAIFDRGCGACHTIPGIRGANGTVAQSLSTFPEQSFIAGELPNVPQNLERWLRDPQALRPNTAMPNLGIGAAEARDIAAYLYSLD